MNDNTLHAIAYDKFRIWIVIYNYITKQYKTMNG